jgi:subtilase family serine protease
MSSFSLRRTIGVLVAVLGLAAVMAAAPAGARTVVSSSGARSAAAIAGRGAQPAGCATAIGRHDNRCFLASERAAAPAILRHAAAASAATCTVNESAGYTPCNLQNAYELASASAKGGKTSTVAVVDAYDDPDAEADMGVYRSAYGLPACTTANGCFEKINQDGVEGDYPTGDEGWGQEISLDLDMVSAICPNCHITLVEANSSGGDLYTAVNEAASLGIHVISDSWGQGEYNGETGYDGDFDHPGYAITFSSGDGAYQGGVQYPSASPYVVSVGGTTLTPASNSRGWNETTWASSATQGSGSGCSAYEAKPPWQHDTGCHARMTADVSAVAANVLGYDSDVDGGGGWYYFFGTSVSSPIIAAVYALVGNAASHTAPASLPYANHTHLHDITTGRTGSCTPAYFCKAGTGYDGPTGLGTPNGAAAF